MKKITLTIMLAMFFVTANSQALLLYGGDNHEEFLGCLNCGKYDSKSIWNPYSTYGSKYNYKSIWNEYGTYGSEYSTKSPWNAYASNPPVIVDKQGNFYGYLTVNEYKSKRANFELANILCKYFKYIREDVGDWYEKIFE